MTRDDLDHMTSLTPQDALVAIMITVSAADGRVPTSELVKIQSMINHLPIFSDYDIDQLQKVSNLVFELLEAEEGLDAMFGMIRDAMPSALNETAYALSCDVAAADGTITPEEARLLEEIRYELDIDRLHAAAIERGARARHMVL